MQVDEEQVQRDREAAQKLKLSEIVREKAEGGAPVAPESVTPKLLAGATESAVEIAMEQVLEQSDLSPAVKEYVLERAAALMLERWMATDDYKEEVLRRAKELKRKRLIADRSRKRNRR